MATVTNFTNVAGGDWNTAGNWDNGIPTASLDAVINYSTFSGVGKSVSLSANGICSGLILIGTNPSLKLLLQSNTIGTQRTITCDYISPVFCDLQDIQIVQNNGGLDANEIDNLIIDLNNSAWAGSSKILYLKGSSAAPTSASAAAKAALVAKGVTITTN